jgi:hypothetical protein
MKKCMVQLLFLVSIFILGVTNATASSEEVMSESVVIDGQLWDQKVQKGDDICQVVRNEFGSCWYLSFDEVTLTHEVQTSNNKIYINWFEGSSVNTGPSFMVPASTDICKYVQNRPNFKNDDKRCEYIRFDEATKSHYVETPSNLTYDTISVMDKNNIIYWSFETLSGQDHRQALMNLNNDRNDYGNIDQIEWLHGEEISQEVSRGPFKTLPQRITYRAILRVKNIDTLARELYNRR